MRKVVFCEYILDQIMYNVIFMYTKLGLSNRKMKRCTFVVISLYVLDLRREREKERMCVCCG